MSEPEKTMTGVMDRLWWQARSEVVEEENAKLRELCKDMFREFARCDFALKVGCGRTFMAVTRFEPRMQELGIEVEW